MTLSLNFNADLKYKEVKSGLEVLLDLLVLVLVKAFNTPYNINESDSLGGSTYMPEVEAPFIKGV